MRHTSTVRQRKEDNDQVLLLLGGVVQSEHVPQPLQPEQRRASTPAPLPVCDHSSIGQRPEHTQAVELQSRRRQRRRNGLVKASAVRFSTIKWAPTMRRRSCKRYKIPSLIPSSTHPTCDPQWRRGPIDSRRRLDSLTRPVRISDQEGRRQVSVNHRVTESVAPAAHQRTLVGVVS